MTNHNLEEAQRWFRQAEFDWNSGRWSLEGEFFADACFKSQQAAEKAVKAFCYARGARALDLHSVKRLFEQADRFLPGIADRFQTLAIRLDKFYTSTRYPDAVPDGSPFEFFSREEAEEALRWAAEILDFVRSDMKALGEDGQAKG